MIFLQCVGSVCRSIKRASYLQGGSEMIMRKNNNRKTKSSGHWALFPSSMVLTTSDLNQGPTESERRARRRCETLKRLSVAGERLLAHRLCFQKLSSWSSARPPNPPAETHHPNRSNLITDRGVLIWNYVTRSWLSQNLGYPNILELSSSVLALFW